MPENQYNNESYPFNNLPLIEALIGLKLYNIYYSF